MNIQTLIERHEKFSACFTWNARKLNARARRAAEFNDEGRIKFESGDVLEYSQRLTVSCSYYYYAAQYAINGKTVTISRVKKLQSALIANNQKEAV